MKMSQRIAIGGAILCAALLWNLLATAQQQRTGPPPRPGMEQGDVLYFNQAVPGPGAGGAAVDRAFTVISAIGAGPGKLVTGAPYSAQETTESVQTLADGNRISHKNSSTVYRDSQGRTRRDQTLDAIGPFGSAANPPNLTFIADPVAKVGYVLDNNAKTARQNSLGPEGAPASGPLPPPPPPLLPPMPPTGGLGVIAIGGPNPPGPPMGPPPGGMSGPAMQPLPAPVNESLGKQTIEGVECEGTRSTVTIPAGAMGNDLPIQIVSERWYSAALQEVILSTHSDPRMGKTTYRLTNISRNEPAPSLFEVPAGYTIIHAPTVSATGFADCVAAGGTVSTAGPVRQCTAADGKVYIEPPPAGSGPRPFTVPFPQR